MLSLSLSPSPVSCRWSSGSSKNHPWHSTNVNFLLRLLLLWQNCRKRLRYCTRTWISRCSSHTHTPMHTHPWGPYVAYFSWEKHSKITNTHLSHYLCVTLSLWPFLSSLFVMLQSWLSTCIFAKFFPFFCFLLHLLLLLLLLPLALIITWLKCLIRTHKIWMC